MMPGKKNKVTLPADRNLNIVNIGHEDRETWDFFVQKYSPGNLLQSFAWGDFKQLMGQKVKRYELTYKNKLVGITQIIFGCNPLGYQTAFLSRGPVLANQNPDLLAFFIRHLAGLCRAQGCMDMIIEPLASLEPLADGNFIKQLKMAPHPHIQPQRTLLVDISGDTETWLETFKPKTRYNVRLAQKKNISITSADTKDGLDDFYSLLQQTAKRQKIKQFPKEYFLTLFDVFGPAQDIVIVSASHKSVLLASLLLVFYQNTAFYLFGGTSDIKREYMANFLLHYEAMRIARSKGCALYDFWGIAVPDDDKYDAWQGISRFKLGFGGEQTKYPQAYRLVFAKGQSRITSFIKQIAGLPRLLRSLTK